MADRPQEKTITDILQVVFSHYKLFLAGFAMFIIGTMIVSLHVPVKYTATTTFERRSDSVTERLGNSKNESFGVMKLTLEQELCSPQAIEAVAEELGLFRDLPRDADGQLTLDGELEKRMRVHEIKAGLLVEWRICSNAIDQVALSCTYTDQELTSEIPNRLVKRYLEQVSGQITDRLQESRDFLRKQASEGEACVDELTKKKIEFESRYGEMMFDNTTALQDRIQETQAEIETVYRQLVVSGQRMEQLKGSLKLSRDTKLKEELKELQKRSDEMLSLHQMTEEHPDVQKLQARIAQVEGQIRAKETNRAQLSDRDLTVYESGLMLQLTEAEGQAEAIKNEINRLNHRLTGYQTVMAKSVPLREEYLKLTKPIKEQQGKVDQWKRLLSEVEMTLASEEANRRTQLKTIVTARKPCNPQFPPFWTIVGIALGGGLAFGYGLAFAAGAMDHSIRTPEEAVERFREYDVPVVGVISEIMTPKERALRSMKRSVLTLMILLALVTTLCFSTYCVLLRLQSPDNYKTWKSAFPVIASVESGENGNSTTKVH